MSVYEVNAINSDRGRRWLLLALLAVAVAGLVAHSLAFDFVTDDAFISFVYARNLARHGQLVFNLGERVEGYTNFLWTLLLAGLLKLGWLPESASRVLGTGFGAATLLVCAWMSRRLRALDHDADGGAAWSAWDALPALLLGAVPGYACWSSGGLETQMFTFFVTLGIALYLDETLGGGEPRYRSSLVMALAALTRPEGMLFFAITGLHRVLVKLARRQPLPTARELGWVAAFALVVVPHLLWRRWYYGWWLPNTFYIKASAGSGAWPQGAYYLRRVVEDFHLWMVPLVLGAGLLRTRERGALWAAGYATLVLAIFGVYVASVGGDFMGLYRFVMPALPLCALLAAMGLRLLLAGLLVWVSAGVVALALALQLLHAVRVDKHALSFIGADRGIDTPAFLRWYTADRAAIGKWFGRYAAPDDYAAVGGAGAQVYYSGIRSLDCYGLNDEHIAHHVPASSSRPGHQKYAPLEYQLANRPTIITSNYYKLGKYDPPAWEAEMWRQRGYRYVSVEVPGLSSHWYSFLLRSDRSLGPIGSKPDEREP